MKNVRARLGVSLASVAIGLALVNWAADRWLPLPAMIFQPDEDLIFVPIPNARRVLPLGPACGGAWITTELDSHGFRGHEVLKAKHSARVLVLGDSLVMAETTRLEETYCARLQDLMGRDGRSDVEVINAGASGYGPDQECLRLEQLLGPFAPDLVVLVICAHNDFGDLLRNKLFRLDDSGCLTPNRHCLDPSLLRLFDEGRRLASRPAILNASERLWDSHNRKDPVPSQGVDQAYIDMYIKDATAEYDEYVTWGDDAVRKPFEDFYDADVSILPRTPSAQFKRALMARVLERMRDDCEKDGVPLFAVIVPSSVDLCPGFAIHVDAKRFPSWSPTRLTDSFSGILEALSIPHLDLTPYFREVGPESLYTGPRDFHWNPAGEELAAVKTARFVRERCLWRHP